MSKTVNSLYSTVILCGIGLVCAVLAVASAKGWYGIPSFLGTPSNAETKPADSSYAACACAQDRVTSMLKAPRTAKFQSGCAKTVEHVEGSNYVVTSYVDAENSFGAMLRQNYRCHVNVIGSSNECNVSCEFLQN